MHQIQMHCCTGFLSWRTKELTEYLLYSQFNEEKIITSEDSQITVL